MSKIYSYQDGFITLIDLDNNVTTYVSEESAIEDNSDLLYFPGSISSFNTETEIYNEYNNMENKSKYLKSTNTLYLHDINSNKYYLSDLNQSTFTIFKEEKNIHIYNAIDLFIKNIGFSDLESSELLDILYIVKIVNEENILFNISYEDKNFVINEVKKLGDVEITNYVLDLKRKKEKTNKFLKLYSNSISEDFKNLFTIKNWDKDPEYDEIKNILSSNIFYKEVDTSKFLNLSNKESEILLANSLYVNIQNKKIKNWIFTGVSVILTSVLSYAILVPYSEHLSNGYQNEYNIQKSIFDTKKQQKSQLEIEKTFDITQKKESKDWINIPYLTSYMNSIGLNIISTETIKVNEEFVSQFVISGEIPKDLIEYMKKNLNLIDYSIKLSANQFVDGQLYVLNFRLKDLDKKISQ
jgi:hypothetical protein